MFPSPSARGEARIATRRRLLSEGDVRISFATMAPTSSQIRDDLREVLEAQPQYSASNTPAMHARLAALTAARDRIKQLLATKPWAQGLLVTSKDGAGNKSVVPWIRVYDPARSPNPRKGFYVVFLFRADGSGVYLSVNQGTQLGDGDNFTPTDPEELRERARKARDRWERQEVAWPGAVDSIDLKITNQSLARSYEPGNVAAVLLERNNLPDDNAMSDALERAIAVYRSVLVGPDDVELPTSSTSPDAATTVSSPAAPTLASIVDQAASALSLAGLRFGDDASHRERVRNFLVSLATRRFVVLAGLSGSGKTQLARRMGQWLGRARVKVVAVRPDWTGPEALLGYEDALQPRVNDFPVWHVPPVLGFLLRARAEPHLPFVLVLDEMNLAHVERYFADVLSGMESGDGCLPDVLLTQGSPSRLVGPADRHPFPSNVFLIGTVNVDETTYQFSPKVLDRASTLEFRVTTEALASAEMIADVMEADAATRDAFLALTRDNRWHLDHPPPWADDFTDRVRGIHRLLARDRFEFGHRAYFEAQRLAALLHAAGGAGLNEALDAFVLQKVLPRLHGGRKRLERCLATLIWYCASASAPGDAPVREAVTSSKAPARPMGGPVALPRSLEKVERMTATLLEHQFASFSE